MQSPISILDRLTWRLSRAAALLALAGLIAVGGNPLAQSAAAPGDDVGSLPTVVASDPPAFVLVGSWLDLRRTVNGVRGEGRVHVERLTPDGLFRVAFYGGLEVRLERESLLTSDVRALWSSGDLLAPGVAQIGLEGGFRRSFALEGALRLGLPLARIYRDPAANPALVLRALGGEGLRYRIDVRAESDELWVSQRFGL